MGAGSVVSIELDGGLWLVDAAGCPHLRIAVRPRRGGFWVRIGIPWRRDEELTSESRHGDTIWRTCWWGGGMEGRNPAGGIRSGEAEAG
jgi:hypothetical protein